MSRLRFPLLLALVLAAGPLLAQTQSPVPPDKGQILVKLPTASAKLTIAGDPTTQTGNTRLFQSPTLEPGSSYSYELVATWEKDGKPLTAKRVVPLLLGHRVLVDFTTEPSGKPKEAPRPVEPEKPRDKPKTPEKPDKSSDPENLDVPPREKALKPAVRDFKFTYETTVTGLKPGQHAKIWLPVASTSADQKVELVERRVPKTAGKVMLEREPRYGNEMLFVEAKADQQGKISLKLVYRVTRHEVRGERSPAREEDMARLARFLEADALVPVGGKTQELLKDRRLPPEQLAAVRVIYDAVNSQMRYSKEGTGWGRGDAVWACDSKTGNCSDFHSVFISLVRSLKIPARFEIGFLLPPQHELGKIADYHCWASFKPRDKGWIPVDISEANKHPELKEYYFGNLTPDRIALSIGRDIDLVPRQAAGPLNFFVFPHVEVDGKEYPREKVVNSFSYQDVK